MEETFDTFLSDTFRSVGREVTSWDEVNGNLVVHSAFLKYARWVALHAAERLVEALRPGCERIEVAGSIRREKPLVKDIELVVIPKMEVVSRDIFGSVRSTRSRLDPLLEELGLEPRIRSDGSFQGLGDKAKFYHEPIWRIPVDLFVTTPEQWGVIFTLRTGSAEFNKRLIERLKQLGLEMRGGRILRDGVPLDAPEERDVFVIAKAKYKEPCERS